MNRYRMPLVRRQAAPRSETVLPGTGDTRLMAQRQPEGNSTQHAPSVTPELEAQIGALHGGQSVPEVDRTFLEPRFGHDLSQIRIFADGHAAAAAEALQARAFTVGDQIVVGAGQYAPGTGTGRELLAHEVTHFMQQTGAAPGGLSPAPAASPLSRASGSGLTVSPPDDADEQEAQRTAEAVMETPDAAVPATPLTPAAGHPAPIQRLAVQRLEEAGNTDEAVALAPSGPLANLRDELDDTFVDEAASLEYIGQLGPGERQLVRQDATLMGQMAEAFNGEEMLAAVERLDFELKWSVYWLKEADEESTPGDTGYGRLIGASAPAEVGELVGWEDVRQTVAANTSTNPLTFPPLVNDDVMMKHIIGTYPTFSDWTLERGDAGLYLRYVAAHDPAATLAQLKAAGKWDTLLGALPRGDALSSVDRTALFDVFKAATDAEDRRRLFEVRFDRRVTGEFDWTANGEAQWTSEEQLAGTQTDQQIADAIAAGNGPKDVGEAVAGDPGGPLEQLRDELDDTFVDEALCLDCLGRLGDREKYLVRNDAAMLGQMASAFNGEEMAQALNLLRFPKIGEAIQWIQQAGEAGDVGRQSYEALINNATSAQVAELIGWPDMCAVVRESSGLDPLALPPLVADDAMMAHVIRTYGHFSDWVIEKSGCQAYLRYLAAHTPASLAPAIFDAGKLPALVGGLPAGAELAPDDQRAMAILFHLYTDIPTKKLLMQKRFNLDSIEQEDAAAPDWDAVGLDRTYDLLERLPPAHLADNEWLKRFTRITMTATTHQGVTGGDRVGMGYDPAQMGRVDTGEFTQPGDQMEGMNIFDGTVIHEMGHAADREYGYSGEDGPICTRADLGEWKEFEVSSAMEALYDELAAGTNLAALGLTDQETADVKMALVSALQNKQADPEDGFKAQTANYGNAGDPWQPLWTKVSGHTIVAAIGQGHIDNSPWNNLPPAVGTRYYEQSYPSRWSSYLTAARGPGKLSEYQFRDKRDFFAEMYATYYMTPADPGASVKAWNVAAYEWFRGTVDQGFTTVARP